MMSEEKAEDLVELCEALKEKNYEKVLNSFPAEREQRIKVIKLMIERLKWFDSIKSKFKKNFIYMEGLETDVESFIEVLPIPKLLHNIKGETEFLVQLVITPLFERRVSLVDAFIIGQDDSGFWVEPMIELLYFKAKRFLSLSEVEVIKDIKNTLLAGENVEGTTIVKVGKYRLQGDINIEKIHSSFSNRIAQVVIPSKLIPFVSKYLEVNSAFFKLLFAVSFNTRFNEIAVEDLQVEIEFKKEVSQEDRENFMVNLLEEIKAIKKEISGFVGQFMLAKEIVIPFENHEIILKNTSLPLYVEEKGELTYFEVYKEAEIIVRSPHHKEVNFTLTEGGYTLSKSGGNTLDQVEAWYKSWGMKI
jgi:hypothetical protein